MSVVDDISETIPFKCYNYSVLFPRILNSVSAMVWFLISLTHLHCYSEYLSFKIIKEAQVVKPLPDRHVSYLISYCEQIRKIRNVRKQGSFGVTPNEVRYHFIIWNIYSSAISVLSAAIWILTNIYLTVLLLLLSIALKRDKTEIWFVSDNLLLCLFYMAVS